MAQLQKYFTSIVLAGYAFFLASLLTTGKINRFINPRLSYLSVLTVLMLGGMFLASLRRVSQAEHGHHHHDPEHGHCECGRHNPEHFSKANLLLLLPLLLSLFIPAETISYQPSTVSSSPPPGSGQTQTEITAPSGIVADRQRLPPIKEGIGLQYEEYTQLDIGNILFDLRQAPKDKLVGSKIFLQGLAARFPELQEDEIVVYRMVISCCVADGLPLGVIVRLPEGTKFNTGEWIGVEGTIELIPFKDELKRIEPVVYMVPPEKIMPYFTADKAYKVAKPELEYLFP